MLPIWAFWPSETSLAWIYEPITLKSESWGDEACFITWKNGFIWAVLGFSALRVREEGLFLVYPLSNWLYTISSRWMWLKLFRSFGFRSLFGAIIVSSMIKTFSFETARISIWVGAATFAPKMSGEGDYTQESDRSKLSRRSRWWWLECLLGTSSVYWAC